MKESDWGNGAFHNSIMKMKTTCDLSKHADHWYLCIWQVQQRNRPETIKMARVLQCTAQDETVQ